MTFSNKPKKKVRLRGGEFFSVYLFTYFYAQDLLNARKREIETENHMKQIGMYMYDVICFFKHKGAA